MSTATMTFGAWGALLARDLRAFFRSRSQVVSSLVLPLLLLAILGIGVSDGLEPSKLPNQQPPESNYQRP